MNKRWVLSATKTMSDYTYIQQATGFNMKRESRKEAIQRLLEDVYMPESEDMDTALVDMATDLLHVSSDNGYPHEDLQRIASNHFEAEVDDE